MAQRTRRLTTDQEIGSSNLPGGSFFSRAARAVFSLFSLVSLFFSRSLPPSGARISLEVGFSLSFLLFLSLSPSLSWGPNLPGPHLACLSSRGRSLFSRISLEVYYDLSILSFFIPHPLPLSPLSGPLSFFENRPGLEVLIFPFHSRLAFLPCPTRAGFFHGVVRVSPARHQRCNEGWVDHLPCAHTRRLPMAMPTACLSSVTAIASHATAQCALAIE